MELQETSTQPYLEELKVYYKKYSLEIVVFVLEVVGRSIESSVARDGVKAEFLMVVFIVGENVFARP